MDGLQRLRLVKPNREALAENFEPVRIRRALMQAVKFLSDRTGLTVLQ